MKILCGTFASTLKMFRCILIVFTIIFLYIFKNRKVFSQYNGPLWLPIFGSAHLIMFHKSEGKSSFKINNRMFPGISADLLWRIKEIVNAYKKPIRFWLGPYLILIFTDLHQIEVSTKYIDKLRRHSINFRRW